MRKSATDRKKMVRGGDISREEKGRESARLRMVGRGRKRVSTPSFLVNHQEIFGETDIFKNLSAKDEQNG